MAEKLTAFDPAEGLTSDDAIAGFMGEAFKTEDVGYIAMPWAWWREPRA